MWSGSSSHEIQPHKALQIKLDDKFFCRLMSKETSMSNSSSMVYYGSASGAIPFMWESHPGTPKHPSPLTSLPPLTPPPSYHSSLNSKSKPVPKKNSKSTLFSSIVRKLISAAPRINHASPSPSSLLSLSSRSNASMNRKLSHRLRGYFSCSCSISPVHNCMDDDDHAGERLRSSASTLCFGIKPRTLNEIRGGRSMIKMKKALLSFVSYD
ncbi:hypothetical protein CXB51_025447 [Gossypium anomalum]|uniref:Uncharacterized protein n=1 Tax=Gossypium anomalum TaxID=47600 RepID=A0A8J5YJJ6_9ROSI|nr:hypothetical protein CXB51_025447 [Gossypium anomalum]